jgi:hypothetical protein
MKIKIITLSALLISSFCYYSCEKDKNTESPEFSLQQADNFTTEEYEIYSLVINESNAEKVVIKQKTTADTLQSYYYSILKENNANIDSSVVINYYQMNGSSYYFDNNFNVSGKEIKLISTTEIQYIFSGQDINDGWDEFFKEYPNSEGIVEFTRIGFNQNHNQALLEIGRQDASLGGSGKIIFLQKVKNTWIIKDSIATWIS